MFEQIEKRQNKNINDPIQRKTDTGKASNGIPNQLVGNIESISGFNLSDVKVNYNLSEPAAIDARAFARENVIHLGPGQNNTLPYESWHVVQQRQGRVQATTQKKGLGVNDDAALEHEADVMGEIVTRGTVSNSPEMPQLQTVSAPTGVGPVLEKDTIYSNFYAPGGEEYIPITPQQAVITITAKEVDVTGQHASIFLEYIGKDGLARAGF